MSSSELNLAEIIVHLLAGSSFVFVNSADAEQPEGDVTDIDRELTTLGVEQATATRTHLLKGDYHSVLFALTSTAQRVVDTLREAVWASFDLPELYFSPRNTPKDVEEAGALDEALNRLKSSSLATYQAEELVGKALKRWGRRAARALNRALSGYKANASNVVVGGHGILLNQLVIEIVTALDPDADVSVALETVLGDAECLELRVVEGRVQIRYLNAALLGHPVPPAPVA